MRKLVVSCLIAASVCLGLVVTVVCLNKSGSVEIVRQSIAVLLFSIVSLASSFVLLSRMKKAKGDFK